MGPQAHTLVTPSWWVAQPQQARAAEGGTIQNGKGGPSYGASSEGRRHSHGSGSGSGTNLDIRLNLLA
eukprot:5617476-Prymnesium_polylepis.1